MKLTPILLIPLLSLSSCTIDWNDEKDKKITELEKQNIELKTKSDDEVFKKKQECIKKFEDSYQGAFYAYYRDIGTDVFYSLGKNTCILRLDGWDKSINKRLFIIYDMLARSTLSSFSVDTEWNIYKVSGFSGNVEEIKCQFNQELNELGGEAYFNINCNPLKNLK